jgi:TM2 domain-containing membrane protein YozV
MHRKNADIAFWLCFFLSVLGIHRFYAGKVGTGIIMLLTGGGFGIWSIIDYILFMVNSFTDVSGIVLVPTMLSKIISLLLILASIGIFVLLFLLALI